LRIRPGRNLVRAIGAVTALSLLTFVWPVMPWLLVAAIAPLAAVAVRDYRGLKERFRQLTIHRTLPAIARRDVPFQVVLQIGNGSSHPLVGRLRDLIPASAIPSFQTHDICFAPGETSLVRAEFRIPVRGRHEFGPVWIELDGTHALFEGQDSISAPGLIKVLPEGFASKDRLEQDEKAAAQLREKLKSARQRGVGTEFESLSEYRQGDDFRRIDWRTTARYRYPIVRRYQIERHRDVLILIDCGRLMGADTGQGSKLDCAIDAGLTLGRVVLESGDRCGLGLFDDHVLGYLPPVSGVRSLRWLSESVYDAETRWRESDFSSMFAEVQSRQTKRSLMIVISDIVDVETSRRFRSSLATLARRHVVLFAALRTPLLRSLVHVPVDSLLDGWRKVVSFRVLWERQQAIHSLKRSGVQILDVEPNQLTVPLINEFIALRQRNLL